MIEVLRASKDGKKIEWSLADDGRDEWVPCPNPVWNFHSCDYRVSQEPRECWRIQFPDGSLSSASYETESEAGKPVSGCSWKLVHFKEVL